MEGSFPFHGCTKNLGGLYGWYLEKRRTSNLQSPIVATAIVIIQTHTHCFKGRLLGCQQVKRDPGKFLCPHSHHLWNPVTILWGLIISALFPVLWNLSLNSVENICLLPSFLAQSSQIILVKNDSVKQKPGKVVSSKQFLLYSAKQTPQRRGCPEA